MTGWSRSLRVAAIAGAAVVMVLPAASADVLASRLNGVVSTSLDTAATSTGAGKGSPSQGSAPQGSAPQGSAPQGSAPQGSAPQGSAPQGSAPQGSAPQGSAPQGSAPQGNAPQSAATPLPRPSNVAPPPGGAGTKISLHVDGSKLVDANGREVRFTGVTWFGFETSTYAPHGLWARNWQDMLDEMVAAGFNTIRLPYSNQLLDDPNAVPTGIDYAKNPDLQGLKGLALMDRIVDGAGRRGLRIILDRHRPTADGQSDLWYTDRVPESQWISDWTMLARHYRNEPAVIGADLHNEPHGRATWGDGNTSTDWRLAAERSGNAILAVNPEWLIFVEGIETYHGDAYWWGGNLEGVAQFPVRLSRADKLVYSAHDYGPGVWGQPWFKSPDFPRNLPSVWQKHWGYLQEQHKAPVVLGEFGGRSVGQDVEGTWQRSLLNYLRANGMGYWYWAWNANSGDTGGILQEDWKTVDQNKLKVIAAYEWPLLAGPAQARYKASLPDVYRWPAH